MEERAVTISEINSKFEAIDNYAKKAVEEQKLTKPNHNLKLSPPMN